MLFCPTCANLLVISAETGYNKWACNTCAYEFPIAKQMTSRTKLTRKQVDDVLGGDETWKHADSTAATCPKCDNDRAYFYQLQIRSADEPMTTCRWVSFDFSRRLIIFPSFFFVLFFYQSIVAPHARISGVKTRRRPGFTACKISAHTRVTYSMQCR